MEEQTTKHEPRILFLDLETSPIIAYTWGPKWDTSLIETIQESQILSYSIKWLNGKQITRAQCDTNGYKPGILNDKELVIELNKLLDEAEIAIGQNSNDFDLKVFNARSLYHNLNPPSPYKVIDTKTEVKKYVRLPSNSLDDVCKYFGLGGKIKHEGFTLWKDCMKGDKKAWTRMKTYNAMDVLILEKLYLKIRPYMKSHPNQGSYLEGTVCSKCGSKHLQRRGYARTLTCVYPRLQCQSCGGWCRGTSKEKNFKVLTNVIN